MWNMYHDYIDNPPGPPNPVGGTPWIVNPLIIHEIGHCLGFWHSWTTCNQFPDLDCPHSSVWCSPSSDFQCSNNIMGYSDNKSHLTPLQLGHMHELLASGWRKGMLASCDEGNQVDLIVDQNEIWEYAKVPSGDIIIEPGNTLTIKCLVSMPKGSKIIIKPGAKCVVDGGTLTNQCCGETWQGIEVWGNSSATQTPSNQGVLKVINGALIENARNAVTLWKPDDWSKTGGIVQASNSTFYK